MEDHISAMQAIRHFGRPVARIQPLGDGGKMQMRKTAKAALLALLKQSAPQGLGRATRDELYER